MMLGGGQQRGEERGGGRGGGWVGGGVCVECGGFVGSYVL